MSIHSNELSSQDAIKAGKRSVDRSVRTLMQELEHENTLIGETPAARFQKVLKIYRGLKPVLAVVSTLPLIPSTWRAALVMFDQALEALSGVSGELLAPFKAGKDL
jgi:hypothetical protein